MQLRPYQVDDHLVDTTRTIKPRCRDNGLTVTRKRCLLKRDCRSRMLSVSDQGAASSISLRHAWRLDPGSRDRWAPMQVSRRPHPHPSMMHARQPKPPLGRGCASGLWCTRPKGLKMARTSCPASWKPARPCASAPRVVLARGFHP
jgi:hypothetical protein